MSHHAKSSTVPGGLKIAACAAITAISLSHSALAETQTSSKRPHHTPSRVSKCLCGYGLSGYSNINCVPVKDCEWEHATCRGPC
jgi:hypothetical protein